MASRTQSTVSSALSWKPPPSRCVSVCRQHTKKIPEPDGTTHIVTMEHYLHALKNTTNTDKMNQSTLNILLLWSDNLDLQSGWCQCAQNLRRALINHLEHGGADQQHDVRVQVLPTTDEQRKPHHRKNNSRISLRMWNSASGRPKHSAPAMMFPSGSSQVFSVSELSAVLFILLSYQNHVTQLFLHIAYTLTFCCGGEGVPSLREDLHQLLCDDLPNPDGGWRPGKT